MAFYRVLPIMAGIPSEETKGDLDSLGPQLEYLKIILELEPPSDIITCGSVFLATERLVATLRKLNPTGVKFHNENLKVVGDENFESGVLTADYDTWWWLEIAGEPGKDDFASSAGLIVSQPVMNVLNQFKLDYCGVEKFSS